MIRATKGPSVGKAVNEIENRRGRRASESMALITVLEGAAGFRTSP